ncbi:MAG: hypothetical protein B7Z37_23545 [Verrucomicrobia bacterium 12-59-8]|nr:MAG: hypothetical protein B7Z37_23545 [Verrucomicrobia bacterium 12-59-8]
MSAQEDLQKVPEGGTIPSTEYVDAAIEDKRILIIAMSTVEVAQVIAQHLVEQGLLSAEAMSNTSGSQIAIAQGEFMIALHGREPYNDNAAKFSDRETADDSGSTETV